MHCFYRGVRGLVGEDLVRENFNSEVPEVVGNRSRKRYKSRGLKEVLQY